MTTMLEHALALAQRQWPVFPLAPLSKVPPRGMHGRLDAMDFDDSMSIMLYWSEGSGNPNHNIGIDTDGAGLIVIDIDVLDEGETAEGPYGYDAWELLMFSAGTSDDRTYTVETPSGGTHYYWLANDAMTVKTISGKLAPGIDVRASNGSIVAAGSKTDKGEYRCTRDITPKPVPNWLRAALRKAGLASSEPERSYQRPTAAVRTGNETKYASAALDGELEKIKNSAKGTANHTLNTAAFKLRRFVEKGELDAAATAQSLYDAALARGQKPNEALATIKSGLGI